MIDKLEEAQCTGCSACISICPRECISMHEHEIDGFLYPKIDETHCIKCDLCEKVCPSINEVIMKNKDMPIIKAAWSLNEEIRMNSTSGGIFSEFALNILNKNGYIVGARYNEEFLVEHYIGHTLEDIKVLRQSKYAQSDKKDIFKKVKNLLDDNQTVLFVGTPCEVAGLYRFLGVEYDRLITADFICLGVNSPKVYKRFLNMLEEKYHSNITKVWFKNKTFGWNCFSTKVEFANGECYLKDRYTDYFMRGYIGKNRFYTRLSCTNCQYKSMPHIADLTLADFWGIGNKDKSLDENKGTSLVMINSKKGLNLFQSIQMNVFSTDCTLADVVEGNSALFNSIKLDSRRSSFFRDLNKIRFDKLIEKYSPISIRTKIKYLIKKYLILVKPK